MWATIMAPIPWSVRRTGRSETRETCVGRLITQRRLPTYACPWVTPSTALTCLNDSHRPPCSHFGTYGWFEYL